MGADVQVPSPLLQEQTTATSSLRITVSPTLQELKRSDGVAASAQLTQDF